ncbi:MAG: restriction endonuclease subunit S [Bacteroidales bacterium]|nr:restriction endonuclease subunit S [Bacteroidales bacterium]
MMEGWKIMKLGCLLSKIIGGGTPSKNVSEYWDGDIPWCSVKDMSDDKFQLYKTEDTISHLGLKNSSSNLIPQGTVVTATRMGLGRAFITKVDMAINQDLKALIPNEKLDNTFLLWLIISKREKLDNLGTGSTVKGIRLETLKGIQINLPPLPTQRRIASILSAYDDLIENNLKRIKLLEEKAQLTYEEWFVRMKFPGHETTPINEETGLPEGWEKSYFEGILNFKTGKLDSNALVVDGKYDFYTCAKEVYKTSTYCFDGEAVLLGGNNATGDFALFYANDKFDAYQRTYIVTAEKQRVPLVYVFYYLKKLLSYFQIVSSGASTKFLTMKILNKTKILIPQAEILNQYQGMIKPCFDLILKYDKQNQLLKEARDIMLPRLMMGVIDTDEMEGVHTK